MREKVKRVGVSKALKAHVTVVHHGSQLFLLLQRKTRKAGGGGEEANAVCA